MTLPFWRSPPDLNPCSDEAPGPAGAVKHRGAGAGAERFEAPKSHGVSTKRMAWMASHGTGRMVFVVSLGLNTSKKQTKRNKGHYDTQIRIDGATYVTWLL